MRIEQCTGLGSTVHRLGFSFVFNIHKTTTKTKRRRKGRMVTNGKKQQKEKVLITRWIQTNKDIKKLFTHRKEGRERGKGVRDSTYELLSSFFRFLAFSTRTCHWRHLPDLTIHPKNEKGGRRWKKAYGETENEKGENKKTSRGDDEEGKEWNRKRGKTERREEKSNARESCSMATSMSAWGEENETTARGGIV